MLPSPPSNHTSYLPPAEYVNKIHVEHEKSYILIWKLEMWVKIVQFCEEFKYCENKFTFSLDSRAFCVETNSAKNWSCLLKGEKWFYREKNYKYEVSLFYLYMEKQLVTRGLWKVWETWKSWERAHHLRGRPGDIYLQGLQCSPSVSQGGSIFTDLAVFPG